MVTNVIIGLSQILHITDTITMNKCNKKLWFLCIGLILSVAVIRTKLYLRDRRGKGKRRWWVRPVNRSRKKDGHYDNLFQQLKKTDHEEFFKLTRMRPNTFDQLLHLISPFLIKRSIRKPLPVELRLALTLTYLAHGDSVSSKSWEFRIGRSTAHKLIPEVCSAIWKALQPTVLPPMTQEKWINIAQGFQEKWQFPNCIGAVDGKHVKIKAPFKSGTEYFCYKKFYSLVLMAICDADYRFVWVDIGQFGSLSDCSIWNNSDFGRMLDEGKVDLPPPKCLPFTNILTHHTFVGDEAFPLKLFMMRPYSKKQLGDAERIFNYRLSRARRVVENAFGILVSRWQILCKTICASPKTATLYVSALVCLHNFLMTEQLEAHHQLETHLYCPPELIDNEDENHDFVDGEWKNETGTNVLHNITRLGSNNPSRSAQAMRDQLRDYFVSPVGEEQAPWQYGVAFRGIVINIPNEVN